MTVNSFAQNFVWASPAGAAGAPSMRGLVTLDIPTTLAPTTFKGASNPAIGISDTAGSPNSGAIAIATSSGAFFSDAAVGDMAIRSNQGTLRLGVGGSTASLDITAGGVAVPGAFRAGFANLGGFSSAQLLAYTGGSNSGQIAFGWNLTNGGGENVILAQKLVSGGLTGGLNFYEVDGSTGFTTLMFRMVQFGVYSTPIFASSSLPTASSCPGGRAIINDNTFAAAGGFGAAAVGGGSHTVPIWSDGGTWFVG